MMNVNRIADNVLEVALSGTVTREDIQAIERALQPLLEGDAPIGLMLDMTGLEDLTADAIAEDIRFEFSLLPQFSRFAAISIVSDKQWVPAVLGFMKPLMPMINFETFTPDRAADARAFAARIPEAKEAPGRAVRLLDSDPGIVAFEIDGMMTMADIDALKPGIDAALAGGGPVNALARIRNYGGFTPDMLTQRAVWDMKLSILKNLRRYAIVGGPPWLGMMTRSFGAVMPMDIRFFEADDEDQAWAWLREAEAA